MKRKKKNWDLVPWTPFTEVRVEDEYPLCTGKPDQIFVNSRYQVTVWYMYVEPFGAIAHLSMKVHDKQARHDFRDMQRIKNEICGTERDAVEVFPAESKLVDGANQYHLWVFKDYRLPFGFQERFISDGQWQNSEQRPFQPGERPADCVGPEGFERLLAEQNKRAMPVDTRNFFDRHK